MDGTLSKVYGHHVTEPVPTLLLLVDPVIKLDEMFGVHEHRTVNT